tara:strand:- start:1017 stop:3416 length:2400 start_codon:yes stop_codon:yes gene_type:complete
MPKQFYKLNDFSGGLNLIRDARDIAPNELAQADNLSLGIAGSVSTANEINSTDGNLSPADIYSFPGGGLFYFESDREGGAAAKDVGERWTAALDSRTGELSLKGDVTGALSAVVDMGTITTKTFNANEIQFSSTSITRGGSGGSINFGDDFHEGDVLRISGCSDAAANNRITRVANIFSGGAFMSTSTLFTTEASEAGTVAMERLANGVFFASDDTLRVADGAYNVGLKRKQYGYVKQIHFEDAGDAKDTYDNWFANDCDLSPPTVLLIHASSYAADGTGFHLNITHPATSSDVIGQFAAKTYQIAGTFIYKGGQESKLYIPSADNTFTTASGDYVDIDVNASPAYDERITGARVYMRPDGTNEPWSLLIDINLRDGCRTGMDDEYKQWAIGSDATEAGVDTLILTSENLETYTILNGFGADEFSITLSAAGEGYKDVIIANRRVFICNVQMVDEDAGGTTLKRMRDRIMYTPPGKYETFPRSFFIDVVKGDSDEYTALATYGDRLFAFKRQTLYVINIGSPSPSNWFLESTERNKGVASKAGVFYGQDGIFWANKYGAFFYDGSNITNLIKGKIPQSVWVARIGASDANHAQVTFQEKKNNFYVVANNVSINASSHNNGVYTYNFDSRAWIWQSQDATSDIDRVFSNFISDGTGGIVFNSVAALSATQTSQRGISQTTDGDGVSATKWIMKTKDIDFGDPGHIKKVYGVRITYQSSIAQTNPIAYAIDGIGNFSSAGGGNFTGDFADTSDVWDVLNATVSSPVECQSMQLKISNPTSTGTIKINDISIEYRPIHKKVT